MINNRSRRRPSSRPHDIDPLEPRRLLASVVYVNDDWTIIADTAPPGLSPGDTVSDHASSISNKTLAQNAFASIASAIASVDPNGTVNLLPGTYQESDIAITKPLTIDGDPAASDRSLARVVPALASARTGGLFAEGVHSAFIIQSPNVTIQDLTIDGNAGVGAANPRNYRGAIVYDYRPNIPFNNITIANNLIANTYDLGVYLDGGINALTNGHSISNNYIHHVTGGSQGAAILLIQANASLANNTIESSTVGISTNSVDGPAYAPQPVIQSNTIQSTPTGMNLASLADGTVIGGPLPEHANNIQLTAGSNGIGILADFTNGQITLQNNHISASGTDSAIWLFNAGSPTKPVLINNNTLTSTASPLGQAGQSTGIFITDDGLLFSADDAPSYATITANTIAGFACGFDLYRAGDSTPTGAPLSATIGSPLPADNNTFTGDSIKGSAAIRLYDHNSTDPANASATIFSSNTVISGYDSGILVDGATASLSGSPSSANPLALSATNSASVHLLDAQRLLRLSISHAARVALTPGGNNALSTSALLIESDASLDLADNDLIITSDSAHRDAVLSTINGYITVALDGPSDPWQEQGLTSSAARSTPHTTLAAVINDKGPGQGPLFTDFANQPVNINDVLVKYTWDGDANLDGLVNADDYFLIDSGYITQKGNYYNGDLNYDQTVNADDYFLIDSSYIAQSAPLLASLFSTTSIW